MKPVRGYLVIAYYADHGLPKGQTDQTSDASAPYSDIKFHAVRFRGYLVIANYTDFKSIQRL